MTNLKNTFKYLSILILLLLTTLLISQDIPQYNGTLINDFANVIPNDKEYDLLKMVKDYETKTSIQMCVVTIPSLEGRDIEDYANTLFRSWGIGQAKLNNGLLILIATNDKRWRIEVGYGLEGWITDAYSKKVGEINFKPNFKKGDYYTGIDIALKSFILSLGEEGIAQRQEFLAMNKKENDEQFYQIIGWVGFFIFVVILIVFGIYSNKRKKEEEFRRLRAIKEKQQIQELIETKRLNKIKEFEQMKVSIKTNFERLQKNVDSFKEKYSHCKDINSYYLSLNNLEQQINEVLISQSSENSNKLIIEINSSISSLLKLLEENICLFQNINKDFNNLKSIILDKKMTLNGVEKTLSKLHENYSEISKDSSESNLRLTVEQSLKEFEQYILDTKTLIDLGEFSKAKLTYNNAEKELNIVDNHINNASLFESKVKTAVSYLSKSKQTLNLLIDNINKLNINNDVSSITKSNLKLKLQSITSFNPDSYIRNPLFGQKLLLNLVNDIEQIIFKAKSEIKDSENKRKTTDKIRQRRKQEQEDSRNNSYSTSSYSSLYENSTSSPSYDNTSQLGGGDSGGGGSNGDW